MESIPHFATVSYAFCQRFPAELSQEIFEHILNKAINNRMVDPSIVYIDGTHIKANANKKKFQKQQVKKAAKIYDEELRAEVNAERQETIERVFADAKEKYAMRYTTYRGLTRVTNWARLKYAAMNLKKLAIWMNKGPRPSFFSLFFSALRLFFPIPAF